MNILIGIILFFPLVLFPGYWLIIRPWHLRWGATRDEVRAELPGDDHVPQARLGYTRAVTIKAPPEVVWPWLVQIGYQRAGWYSYDRLEGLVGAADFVDGNRSSRRIVPELQDLKTGDLIRIGDEPTPALRVAALEPHEHLVLFEDAGTAPDDSTAIVWSFHLKPAKGGGTRLIARQRLAFRPTLKNLLLWHVTEFFNFIMERKMMLGLKGRAERHARQGKA
jgi:hypothetical protein